MKIPTQIKSMKQISMDYFIEELNNAKQLSEFEAKRTPTWMYFVCTLATLFVIMIIAGTTYWLLRGKKFKKVDISKPLNFRHVSGKDAMQTPQAKEMKLDTEELDLEFI